MDSVQETGSHSTVIKQRAYNFKRTEVMDMPTLKRERERLLKLQERHENRITFLVTELKQTKHKFESMEATLSQERSKFTQIKEELQRANCKNETMTVKVDELQILLKEVEKENKHLEGKYQKEKFKCKQRKEDLDHTNCQNNIMTKKVEELQVQIIEAMVNNKCVEGKYEKEHSTYMNTIGEMERHTQELQLQLKQAEKEKKLEEEKYQNEKHTYTKTQAQFELAISKLQSRVRQAEEENKLIEKEYQDKMYVLQNRKKELEQLVDELRVQLKLLEEENKSVRDKYQIEISNHKNTREKLNQEITELQVQLNLAEEEKAGLEGKHLNEILTRKELNRTAVELKHQLKQVENDNKCVEQKYQHEFSKHRVTCEELDKARCEKHTLIEKLEDFEEQRENEMLMKDLQIQQLQTNEKKLKEDLLTLEHAKAENTHRIENLRDKLHACGVFMRYLLDTRNKLRDNLSNKDKFYGEREKRYVKLVNMHIQKQHEARKRFKKMKKSAQTWPQKLCCWWNERLLRHNTSMSSWEEETSFYPDEWRLPDIGKAHTETFKCNKND
ncbi:COP1-interactive protein 1-like [Takifugu rubripes]|uniref:COP1-interactive protein 1-like n=1 Tax=Takifugu rubripes TaxID=31033 RepID=UPI001146064F|nr:COP1-interactive protein 1-like [Takifugu rubripes]